MNNLYFLGKPKLIERDFGGVFLSKYINISQIEWG